MNVPGSQHRTIFPSDLRLFPRMKAFALIAHELTCRHPITNRTASDSRPLAQGLSATQVALVLLVSKQTQTSFHS